MKNLFVITFVVLFATNAFAGGYITPGIRVPSDSGDGIIDGSVVAVQLDEGLSYCCSFHPDNGGMAIFAVSTTVAVDGAPSFTAVDRTGATPSLTASTLGYTGSRLCFTATKTGTARITISDIFVNSQPVTTICEETTLYGDFNTNANPFNFLEITNISNSTITGKIYATSYDGTTVINGTSFTIPSNRRVDTSIHDAAGPNVFGSIKIVHDGPLGSLKAKTSYYSGPVSALELKATVPATIRDRH